MTTAAFIRQADLNRIAQAVKLHGVSITIEQGGRTITVSPGAPGPAVVQKEKPPPAELDF